MKRAHQESGRPGEKHGEVRSPRAKGHRWRSGAEGHGAPCSWAVGPGSVLRGMPVVGAWVGVGGGGGVVWR
jgi:hypothetical protein